MSEFQKPYSSAVTEERYRRIFKPLLTCEGCFFNWKAKNTPPCSSCVRVPAALQAEIQDSASIHKKDYFTGEYVEDMQNPVHFVTT